jgi:tetratricopeptide (TPR) repeat protein
MFGFIRVSFFEGAVFLGALSVSACSNWSSMESTQGKAPAYIGKVIQPIGFSRSARNVESEAHSQALNQVNATFHFLVAETLRGKGQDELSAKAFDTVYNLDPESEHLLFVQAQADLKDGRFVEGIARTRKILEKNPRHREGQILLANLYATTKDYGEAKTLFQRLEQQFPDDEEIALYLSLIDIEEKNFERASRRLTQFVARNKEAPLANFYLGRIEQERGRPQAAMAFYKKALESRPGFVQAGTYLGFMQEEINDKIGAIETYSWLADQTDDVVFYKKLTQLHLDMGDNSKALLALENLERVDPQDLNTRLRIGLLHLEKGEKEHAVKKFKQILKASPESENIHFYLAAVLEDLGKYEESLKHYVTIKTESKLFFESLKRRIFIYGKLKQQQAGEEALAVWDAEFEIDEDYFESRALFFENLKTPESKILAFKAIEQGLEKFPKSESLIYLQAAFFEKHNDRKKAIAVMSQILKSNPNHPGALNFVGYLWADQGLNLDKAKEYIERALKFKPKDPYIRDSLAWVYYKRGDYPKAREILEQLKVELPNEPIILEHLADVLVKMGILGEAKKLYEEALKHEIPKDSDRENVQVKLAEINGKFDRWACVDLSSESAHETRGPASVEPWDSEADNDIHGCIYSPGLFMGLRDYQTFRRK